MLYSSEYQVIKYFSAMLCLNIVPKIEEIMKISIKNSMMLYVLHIPLLTA